MAGQVSPRVLLENLECWLLHAYMPCWSTQRVGEQFIKYYVERGYVDWRGDSDIERYRDRLATSRHLVDLQRAARKGSSE